MTDNEITEYLVSYNYEVKAQDFLMDVLNTSHQIIDRYYDFHTGMMTIITPENVFTFKWKLGKYE